VYDGVKMSLSNVDHLFSGVTISSTVTFSSASGHGNIFSAEEEFNKCPSVAAN